MGEDSRAQKTWRLKPEGGPAARRGNPADTALVHGDQHASPHPRPADQNPGPRAGLGRLLGSFAVEDLTWP